jgi:carbonic anhydrase
VTETFKRLPADLVNGYARFRQHHYQRHLDTYQELAEGQNPGVMIIGCCDSRVDPTVVFDARPGELFVLRNVANLVPPFDPGGHHQGTSAALEFAVRGLEVSDIVIMGHARCGGIAAYIEGIWGERAKPTAITRWMSIVHGARSHMPVDALHDEGKLQQAMEHAAIANSIDNLLTFPFVRDALNDNKLSLHGLHFGIAEGMLEVMDPMTGHFSQVPEAPPTGWNPEVAT